ncbi:mRNA-decapping enzyme subunit 2, partial [Borealophlyctis nickersoniae]
MSFQHMSFEEVLDDLQSRFIINIPEEELSSVERICFQIEQAHWFYEDFIREENPRLPSFSLKHFSARFFRHCPLLHQWAHDHEKAFQTFMEYKVRVPVCGAIILNENMDKVLLVKGWRSSSGWGFPKGKINKDEPEAPCAQREVMEETGFDIGPYLDEHAFVERTMREQRIRLYIVRGVPETTAFAPQTRKEIGDIKWHKLSELPGWNKDDTGYSAPAEKRHKFYMVTAFVSGLRQWMVKYRKAKRQGKGKNGRNISVVMGYKTATDSEGEGTTSDPGWKHDSLNEGGMHSGMRRPLGDANGLPPHQALPMRPEVAAMSIKALIGVGGSSSGSGMSTPMFVENDHMPHLAGLPQHPADPMYAAMQAPLPQAPYPSQLPMPMFPSAPTPGSGPYGQPLHPGGYPTSLPPTNRDQNFHPGIPMGPPPVPPVPAATHIPLPNSAPAGPVPIGAVAQNREAHRATLLDILTKGPGAQMAATIPVPMSMTGPRGPPPPPPSNAGWQREEEPAASMNALGSEGLMAQTRSHEGPGEKRKILMDILMGGGTSGQDHPGNVLTPAPGRSHEDGLRQILGIAKPEGSSVEVQNPPLSTTATEEHELRTLLGIKPGSPAKQPKQNAKKLRSGAPRQGLTPPPVSQSDNNKLDQAAATHLETMLGVSAKPPLLNDSNAKRLMRAKKVRTAAQGGAWVVKPAQETKTVTQILSRHDAAPPPSAAAASTHPPSMTERSASQTGLRLVSEPTSVSTTTGPIPLQR